MVVHSLQNESTHQTLESALFGEGQPNRVRVFAFEDIDCSGQLMGRYTIFAHDLGDRIAELVDCGSGTCFFRPLPPRFFRKIFRDWGLVLSAGREDGLMTGVSDSIPPTTWDLGWDGFIPSTNPVALPMSSSARETVSRSLRRPILARPRWCFLPWADIF